ncbi:MAG: ABC transporter permease [Vicinamibacterales bacterium]
MGARWRVPWLRRGFEADMDEEMRFHVEMEADRLVRLHGLDRGEARRQALVHFGGVEKYKLEGRQARGFYWLDNLSLDARLGLRMLVKHRWLTLVGGLAMAVAIAIGATAYACLDLLIDPALPLPQGDRIVAIDYVSARTGDTDAHVLHVFNAWRHRATSLETVGAFRTVRHNLIEQGAVPEPVEVAEITASGFDLAQTPPLLGRLLVANDERPGAPSVVVIGYEAWRVRFGGDPQIIGRTLRLSGTPYEVVGVMPEGFGFPVDHQFWVPLHLGAFDDQPWRGPELRLFARLAPGATEPQAQAELTTLSAASLEGHPEDPDGIRPVVVAYKYSHMDLTSPTLVWVLGAARILVGALAFAVAVNLAILLYARTVTRMGEIAVRTALGASRFRLLSQLFIEALALTSLGAGTGLVASTLGLRQFESIATANGWFPFWMHFELSPASVLYGAGLAVLAALVMGVVPGLKATGPQLAARLQDLHGRTSTRLGAWWTMLVVAQVAVAVAILPAAGYVSWHVARTELRGPAIAVDRIVVADMNLEGAAPDREHTRQRLLALMARLEHEPGVTGVTFSSNVPGFGPDRRIELPDGRTPPGATEVAVTQVDVGLLKTYGARMLAGRDLEAGDARAAHAVVVNRTFAEQVLGRGAHDALGQSFRYSGAPAWIEVVGVVDDFPGFPRSPLSEREPTVYQPVAPGDLHPAVVSLRFAGPIPTNVTERLREAGAQVDPALQLRRVRPLSDFYDELRWAWRMVAWAAVVITTTVLLLSAAGMHALMAFTIAQRTREIGIRSALGASARQLLLGILGRAVRQLSIGVAVGAVLSLGTFSAAGIALERGALLLLAVSVVIALVAAAAALGPARRSLRLPTVEALRIDG